MKILNFAAATFLVTLPGLAEDWSRFRGPSGQGLSSSKVPAEWTESNLAWSAPLPGEGSSSPIVIDDRIFLTCYSGEAASGQRHLVCVSAADGKLLWKHSVDAPSSEDSYRGYLTEHGYASGTPVSDGKFVYAFFGKAGVVACTMDGEEVWRKGLGQMSSNRRWGSGASPVLHGGILIVNASEEARAVYGLSTKDGSEIWKAPYDGLELCFATPVLVEGEGGVTEAVISMPGEVWGINADTGKLRWFCENSTGGNVSPSVTLSEDTFFTFGGYPQTQTNAIKRGGRKDISESHRIWNVRDSSYVATPLFFDGHLYWVSDRGQSFVVDAATGETVHRSRLSGLASGGRPFYASPVKAGDYIYVVSRRSGTFVFEATPEMKQVAHNAAFDESDFNATPAIVNNRIFMRSNEKLYCIE